MQDKVAVTLIVFLFPALIVPLFVISYLTGLPKPIGPFFTDYSFIFLWGTYLLLAIAGVLLYRYFKRRTAQQALAGAAALPDVEGDEDEASVDEDGASADESGALVADSQQE